jgi:hypothetical protein
MVQPVAHRTLSCVPVAALANWPLSSFLRATIIKFTDCSVCHRIVRCATGLSGEQTEQLSTSPTVDCADGGTVNSAEVELQSQNAPECPVCHWTVRCRKRTNDFNGQQLQTPMIG